jgi:glycolate oxidase FAD binding subunit
MPASAVTRPDTNTLTPADVPSLVELIRAAAAEGAALFPVGGGTSLPVAASVAQGRWVHLTELARVIDYPAADMTITVQAGMRMGQLREILAEQNQQLPLDVPQSSDATLGGVIATNFSGPRRYGYGTARDYVIGIRAVDGHANEFAGGGRVVKNVAGYDFCKLLTGSHGTLGIMTEVTLKLKPLASHRAALLVAPANTEQLEAMLSRLVDTSAQPVAIEWLTGDYWRRYAAEHSWPGATEAGWLVLYFEGLASEVAWMTRTMQDDWAGVGARDVVCLEMSDANRLLSDLSEFVAVSGEVVFKANVLPSRTVEFVRQIASDVPECSIQAHAGSGIIKIAIPELPASGLSGHVIGQWQPLAAHSGGNVEAIKHPANSEFTARLRWGSPAVPRELMQRLKQQFDPKGILNPGAYIV